MMHEISSVLIHEIFPGNVTFPGHQECIRIDGISTSFPALIMDHEIYLLSQWRDRVSVRIRDAIEGTIVTTRAPITRGLGNHVER